MAANETWVCCQLGAREHYAIPRALAAAGRLRALITDLWVPPGSALARAPRRGGLRQLGERFHPELARVPVLASNLPSLAFEAWHRALGTPEWPRIRARDRAFQRTVAARLDALAPSLAGQPVAVFAYSYAAREILRAARRHGWRTVLGQIDPGPADANLVLLEEVRHYALRPQGEARPPGYWAEWREECDLADEVIVNSPWARDCLREVGVPMEKLKVVPLAYQPDGGAAAPPKEYPARFTAERPLRVLFLGKINLRKGVARLLGAAQALRQAPVEFWMVGQGQLGNLEAAAAGARIRWVGPVARGQAAEFYRAADVFVLPTLSDGFALTQLEALAQRLPVIASAQCGRVVRDGVDGRVLPAPTAEGIAAALRECLDDPARLAAWSAAAEVRPEFTLASLARRLLE